VGVCVCVYKYIAVRVQSTKDPQREYESGLGFTLTLTLNPLIGNETRFGKTNLETRFLLVPFRPCSARRAGLGARVKSLPETKVRMEWWNFLIDAAALKTPALKTPTRNG